MMNLRLIAPLILFLALNAQAADIPGSKDPAELPRYSGSEIIQFEQRAFDEHFFQKAALPDRGGRAKYPDAYVGQQGKYTYAAYRVPAGRSVLEVYRNYEQALSASGYETVYSCSNEGCGGIKGRAFNEEATPKKMSVYMGFHEKDQRYLLARKNSPTGSNWVSVYLNRAYSIGGEQKDKVHVVVHSIQAAAMEQKMEVVAADELKRKLRDDGRVALYAILFDSDKADLKPESLSSIAEISKLMKSDTKLQVLIVGHTDNVGNLEYNRALSERRAKAVVSHLSSHHGISSSRLTAVGVGMAAPLQSNSSELGRAKNRRVEVVSR